MKETTENEVPCVEPVKGLYQLVTVSCSLPPGSTTNCFVIGEPGGAALIVDPSPRDDGEYGKLRRTLRGLADTLGFTYSMLMITHHHWDHHQNLPPLARELAVPVLVSRDSYDRIIKRAGPAYFENISVHHPVAGDRLLRWLGQWVRVFEVPGHDEGQLALAPENMAWFLVGDLIQGAGTVVIGTDEGDMRKYFQTLEHIIQLKPNVLLPSHGEAQKSVGVLKKTLKHRIQREKQVLHLHQKGLSPEQMVEQIYRQVDRRLWPLALENIKSHLKKIQNESSYPPVALIFLIGCRG